MDKHHSKNRNTDQDTGFNSNVNQDLTPRRINLNESGIQDLAEGLGWNEGIAGKFIEYRNGHGKFRSWEDLSDVPGIESLISRRVSRNHRVLKARKFRPSVRTFVPES